MTPSFDSSDIPALYQKFRDLVDYPDSPFTCSEQTGDDGAQYEVYSYRIASYTDFLRDHALWSRGIMFRVKPTLDLVCLPQFKFFNVSECPFTMGLENEPIKLILNKLDGSLISHFLDLLGNLRLKSKTSLHSTQAVSAMAWLEARPAAKAALAASDRAGYTTNMEWISPQNRIVLAYPEDNLVVLNVVNRTTGEVILPGTDKFKFDFGGLDVVEVFDVANTLADLQPVIENGTDMEGYVVQFANGTIAKQKINFYTLRHKFIDDIWSDKKLFELCLHDQVDDMLNLFNTNPVAVDRITAFRILALKTLKNISSQVEIFHNTNKHLDRKSYAILGQKEMNATFSLCMNSYLGRETNYPEHIMKNFDNYVTPNLSSTHQLNAADR